MLDKKRVLIAVLTAELTMIFVAWGAMGAARVYLWRQKQFERVQQTHLERATTFWKRQKFKACLTMAGQVSLPQLAEGVRELLHRCQKAQIEAWLEEGRELAASGSYQSAIHTVRQIPQNHPQSEVARQLILDWSVRMLELAEESYQQATAFPRSAIAIASAIPHDSPLYSHARVKIGQWRQNWQQNAELEQNALAFLKADRFSEAQRKIEQIVQTPSYWTTRVQEIENAIAQRKAEKEKARKAFWQKVGLVLLGGSVLSWVLKRS